MGVAFLISMERWVSKSSIAVCILAAVALAAPTQTWPREEDTIVAEHSDSKVVSRVADRVSQLSSSSQYGNLSKKTIDHMLDDIADHTEPSIITAHAQDQSLLNAKWGAVELVDSEADDTFDALSDRVAKLSGVITEHNNFARKWDIRAREYVNSINDYERTVKDMTSTCCKQQQLAIPSLAHQPAYSMCDFTKHSADECVGFALKKVKMSIQYQFVEGSRKYHRNAKQCESDGKKTLKKRHHMNQAHSQCNSYADSTRAKAAIARNDRPGLKKDWNREVVKYKETRAVQLRAYTAAVAQVKTRAANRRDNWSATQKQKCVLKVLKNSGGQAALHRCKENISREHLRIAYPRKRRQKRFVIRHIQKLTNSKAYASSCEKKDDAKEAADKNCQLHPNPPLPVCKYHNVKSKHNGKQKGAKGVGKKGATKATNATKTGATNATKTGATNATKTGAAKATGCLASKDFDWKVTYHNPPGFAAVNAQCKGKDGTALYGWTPHAVGSATHTVLADGNATIDYGNCWNSGTVSVYHNGKNVSTAGTVKSKILDLMVKKGDTVAFNSEGENSVIEINKFCVAPTSQVKEMELIEEGSIARQIYRKLFL